VFKYPPTAGLNYAFSFFSPVGLHSKFFNISMPA